ncbi:MAG TPA: nucleotide exchange factor GrpE [Anaeromyxobacter sp.]
MSDERRDAAAAGGEAPVKVTDRRRFTPEGEPLDPVAREEPPPKLPEPDERDRQLEEQAARIDELSRAYAALIEDNKAFRGRTEREKARVIEAEQARVAQTLLEAADDLERALAAVSGAGEEGSDALRGLVDGVRLSLGALHKRIAEIGAIRISVAGQPFDPHVAEAVDTVAVANAEQDGMVVQEVRAGYTIGNRVLRPARVRVGRLAQA